MTKKKKRKPLIRGTGWILQRNIGQKINSKCASLWARVQACLGGGSGRRFREPQEWKMGMLHLHLPFLQRVGSSAAVTHRTSPHSDKEGSRPPPSCQAPASWPHSHWNLTYSFTNDYVGCTSVTCVGSSLFARGLLDSVQRHVLLETKISWKSALLNAVATDHMWSRST